ncbi:MAG TPA: ZIP family metal transporter [Pyrinomonadaceae bacterium]|nr:ZIP family metal transporter [Pyrinomonadaceae bacterium]
MNISFLQILVLGLIAASANGLGGLILLPSNIHSKYRKLLRFLVALGAGFMLSVTFIELMPEIFKLWQRSSAAESSIESYAVPMLLLLGGYLLTQFFEHTIAPHFHLGEDIAQEMGHGISGDASSHEHGEHLISTASTYTALGGFMIHTFFDGVAIAAASQINSETGLLVFIAVFLHKFPEGFTTTSLVLAAGKSWKKAFIATNVVGLTTLIGVLGYFLFGNLLGVSVAYALPVATGVTLYVAASDLIPEVNHHGGKNPLVSLFVFAGVALFFLIHYLLHILLGI